MLRNERLHGSISHLNPCTDALEIVHGDVEEDWPGHLIQWRYDHHRLCNGSLRPHHHGMPSHFIDSFLDLFANMLASPLRTQKMARHYQERGGFEKPL